MPEDLTVSEVVDLIGGDIEGFLNPFWMTTQGIREKYSDMTIREASRLYFSKNNCGAFRIIDHFSFGLNVKKAN